MDNKTLEALKQSIKKWKKKIFWFDQKLGHRDCPLCNIYVNINDYDSHCLGCPVQKKTNTKKCSDTPYFDASYNRLTPFVRNYHAYREYKFLKSLLPK